jgi:hypothetical protein
MAVFCESYPDEVVFVGVEAGLALIIDGGLLATNNFTELTGAVLRVLDRVLNMEKTALPSAQWMSRLMSHLSSNELHMVLGQCYMTYTTRVSGGISGDEHVHKRPRLSEPVHDDNLGALDELLVAQTHALLFTDGAFNAWLATHTLTY